jgi:hypothetical protein
MPVSLNQKDLEAATHTVITGPYQSHITTNELHTTYQVDAEQLRRDMEALIGRELGVNAELGLYGNEDDCTDSLLVHTELTPAQQALINRTAPNGAWRFDNEDSLAHDLLAHLWSVASDRISATLFSGINGDTVYVTVTTAIGLV